MRTRTNVYFNSGKEKFLSTLKNFYPSGSVEIVCDDLPSAYDLAKLLTLDDDYNAIVTPTDKYDGREYFCVAMGKKAYFAARKNCKGRFVFYVTEVFPDIFIKGEKFPEFLYFDEDKYNSGDINAVRESYVTLLCLTAEGAAVFYKGKEKPFSDKVLSRALERGRDILVGRADRREYIKSAINLSKEIAEILAEYGINRLISTAFAESGGGETADYAECGCFLHRTLILFTKWNFRDMLIASENKVEGVSVEAMPSYGKDDLIFTDEDVKTTLGFVAPYKSKSGLSRLFERFGQTADKNNLLFAEINNRGIYEGIIEYG